MEGDLDQEVLNAILAGFPLVRKGGTKYALQGIVLRERAKTENDSVFFLRDRDFDFEPSQTAPHLPAPITTRSGVAVGWCWFRHCIECYLLEPALAAAALDRPVAEFDGLLLDAGQELANYQAARWAIGQVRSKLPPSRHLETHPPQVHGEFALPQDISEPANWNWISTSTREFIQPVAAAFEEDALRGVFEQYKTRVASLDTSGILVWFSGKDLLANVAPRLGTQSPGQLRSRLRNWVLEHPEQTLAILPEWAALKSTLAQ
ncbi:MAG: hypothetical protein FJ387_09530 [Verrucomicrobia bacterium]|nr:hypothetical protein [Verrucomicrobiota bacterium]